MSAMQSRALWPSARGPQQDWASVVCSGVLTAHKRSPTASSLGHPSNYSLGPHEIAIFFLKQKKKVEYQYFHNFH